MANIIPFVEKSSTHTPKQEVVVEDAGEMPEFLHPNPTYAAVENVPVLDNRDASALADRLIDEMIDAVRRDPAVSPRAFDAWAIALAPLRERIAKEINSTINGHADLGEVLATIEATGC